MLRRPFLPRRPPCIPHLRRLATSFPYPDVTARHHPSTALSISIAEHGLRPSKENDAVSSNGTKASSRVRVIDPKTGKEVSIDLNNVEPFTHLYGLLPLRYRTFVERRHLFETLRKRQNTEYEVKTTDEDDEIVIRPDPALVKKYVHQFIRNRRMKMDEPPDEKKIKQYIELAKTKAIEKKKKQLLARDRQPAEPALSFEEQWHRRELYGKNILAPMTSKQIARYNPNRDLKAPVKPRNVTIEQLLAAGCHIGHNKSSCHPAMKPFIAGLHDKLHIINLDYTIAHLRRACTVVREVAFRHGVILVIGTRKGHKPILVKATERMGSCLLHRKWIPGTVTNSNNVLFRGYLTEVATPFKTVEASEGDKKVADGVTRSRMVWDHGKAEWVEANDDPHEFRDWKGELRLTYPNIADAEAKKLNLPDLIGDSEGASLSREIFKQARRRGDLAEWMAWEKFASIVQNVSNTLTEIIAVPEQTLPESLADFIIDPIAEYIPDHSDHWYARQLENENAEIRHRQKKSYETGDRTPIEMYELDKFLARHKYAGAVRGSYMSETRRNNIKEDGLQAYKGVTVFRDGSTKVGQRRFDRKGNAIIQYSDGSYMMDNRLYDHDGKRYDAQSDSLVFSDGSALKFVGENKDKLVVLIGDKVFDVTSTVVGSSQKREILEKAADLLQQESGNASPSVSREEDFITQFLGAPQGLVSYPIIGEKAIEKEKAEEFGEDEYIGMRGDEMLDISDKVDAVALDELLQKSVRLNEQQEDLEDVQKPDPEPETPFDNMFKKSTATLRPDLIILLNPRENRLALREAANNQIPTIGITDTDCDPRSVTYSIPSNDDSLRSVEYLIGVLSRAGEEGLIHRNRYAKQLQFLEERAQRLLRESRLDYEILHAGEDIPVRANSDRTVGSVVNQYCQWYNLDPKKTELSTLEKIVGQHIVMSQNEIKRLNKDTKGWSMQDFLDHVKTSTQFPGVPSGVLEEMAQTQLTQSRQAWAEARKTMDRRERGISPEYMGPSREFNRVNT